MSEVPSTTGNDLTLKDVLEERRNRSDVAWVSKTFVPKPAYVNPSYVSDPILFRYKILTDENIHLLMRQVYPNESSSDEFHRIDQIVNEMGYLKNTSVVRWLGLLLIKILKKTVESIFISEAKLLRLKHDMGKNPVIFLPTHRSYADFILMAFLCFNYDIEIPVVIAGMDFYAMFGMATLLRRCGAMYMRRSFKDDKVYGAIFKKYVQTVIAMGDSPFEFFIEGTRSRCGKSLAPKLGVLKMVVEVYTAKQVEDITFVPITINYERLIEDLLFAREMLGIPKPKESTTGMLKGISMLEEQYGNIYVNFGKEISLKEFSNENQQNEEFLPRLAHFILNRQQENTVVTFFNIFSATFLQCLFVTNKKSFKISFLSEQFKKLSYLLSFFGAMFIFKDNFSQEIQRNLNIHKFLKKNIPNDSIEIDGYDDESNSVSVDETRTAIPFILLQHYSNCCYFFLINPAIIIAILKSEKKCSKNSLFTKFAWFRTLFKYEFAFHHCFEHQDFEQTCSRLRDLNIIKWVENDQILLNEAGNQYTDTCVNLLIPYLNGYLFVCESLISVSNKNFEQKCLKTRIKKQLELELDVSNDVSLFYALSSHFLTCTFSSLIDASILGLDSTNQFVSVVNSQKLHAVVQFLRMLLHRKFETKENTSRFALTKAKL
ncbi:dihydroxyacetone phosphate acyltransferase-like isoform X2 [Planococcus citri]|uniref:dihydroxyacetone phosphate acyltransferase-like isoform X2 n=1 Tax=Planococcus citri TaxID=170843 RepID=UPI0031F75918